MMTQNDFEFVMAYTFYVQEVAPEWAKDTDVDTHWQIGKGLFLLFDDSKYNNDLRSYLGCVNDFLTNLSNILNNAKQIRELKPGMWVKLLDGSLVKVIAKGTLTGKKNLENNQDLFIVFDGAEDKLEYYSRTGKNNTILNQHLSPKDIVKVITDDPSD